MVEKSPCSFLLKYNEIRILDCTTGTGDQIIALLKKNPEISSITGVDLSPQMIEIAKKKIAKKSYASKVHFQVCSALGIPFQDNTFECMTISFGIRNVTDIMSAFKEFRRVLKPYGRLLVLEGTVPEKKWLQTLHLFYLRHCLPYIGGAISKNAGPYRYLNKTIETFPQGEKFCTLMRATRFVEVKQHPLFGGVTTIYQGDKDAPV